MIEILICLAILGILTMLWKDMYRDWGFGLLMSFFIFIIGGMFIAFLIPFGEIKRQEIGRINCEDRIYSLKNETGISGQFFLGSGYINSTEYYYIFRNKNGGFYREQLEVSRCMIFQDENKEPKLTWQQVQYTPSKWIWLWPKIQWEHDTVYYLHVPTNTIIQEFHVN